MDAIILYIHQLLSAQTPIPASTTLILVGALLLVVIILGGVLWVSRRRR